jgi:hypothetical protein
MSCNGGGACIMRGCSSGCTQSCTGAGDCRMEGCSSSCTQTCLGGGQCIGGGGSTTLTDGGSAPNPSPSPSPSPSPNPGADAGIGGTDTDGACIELAALCGECSDVAKAQQCAATASAGSDAACRTALTSLASDCGG